MVAYSFNKRFVGPIRRSEKAQTIRALRAGRSRHARPDEALQLYFGMRTSHCERIIPDVPCTVILPVQLAFGSGGRITCIRVCGFEVADRDDFAVADGFSGVREMSDFWFAQHGLLATFDGVLIGWAPRQLKDFLP